MKLTKKYVILAPHIDDEVIGCGGYILNNQKDSEFHIIYFSSGDSREEREKEAKRACQILGIKSLNFLRLKEFEIFKTEELLKKLHQIYNSIAVDFLLIPHENESDIDHKAVYNIGKLSLWTFNTNYFRIPVKNKIKNLICYEVHTPLERYSFIENISECINTKIKALEQFSSQTKKFEMIDAVKGLNAYRAIMNGVGKFAEVFKIEDENKCSNP